MKNDEVVTILRSTNDGNDLADWQLCLCQDAINGGLNERGIEVIDKLLELVSSGEPYKFSVKLFMKKFFGIEPEGELSPFDSVPDLTYDQQGYIYWKGECVDHYTYPESEESYPRLWNLINKCRHLENLGLPPGTAKGTFKMQWWKSFRSGDRWLKFFSHLYEIHERKEELLFVAFDRANKCFIFTRTNDDAEWSVAEQDYEYHAIHKQGWYSAACQEILEGNHPNDYEPDGLCRQVIGFTDATVIIEYLERRKVDPTIFDSL